MSSGTKIMAGLEQALDLERRAYRMAVLDARVQALEEAVEMAAALVPSSPMWGSTTNPYVIGIDAVRTGLLRMLNGARFDLQEAQS